MRFLKEELLVKCAEVSSLAYAKSSHGVDKTKVQDWMEDIEFLDNNLVYVKDEEEPDNPYKDIRIFFGFRGTDTSSIINFVNDGLIDLYVLKSILSDITVGNDDVKFHKGFKKRSKAGLKQILAKLNCLYSTLGEYDEMDMYEIILCGHSLGGAVAGVSLLRIKSKQSKLKKNETEDDQGSLMEIEGKENINLTVEEQKIVGILPSDISCVTFGAPTFGNKENQEYCTKKKFSKQIYNVAHIKDIVPKIFYRIPEQLMPRFMIKANAAIGNFKIIFDDSIKEFEFSNSLDVENLMKNRNFEWILDHHGIYSYLNYFSEKSYGNTIEDILTRTNMDLEVMKKPFRVNEKIGEGSYGFVMKGIDTIKKNSVAIKKIKTDQGIGSTVTFEQKDNHDIVIENDPEISTLKKINHENIVKMYDCCIYNESKIYLILELCDSDLHNFIKNQGNSNEEMISLVLKDCLLGLQQLHKANIIHRDIKPGNILVSERKDGNGKIYKISDLGSTSPKGGKTTVMTVRGTKLYMSPELYLAFTKENVTVRLNPQTDIFSIAASMLYCGKKDHPWTEHDLKYNIFVDGGDAGDSKMEEILDMIFPNKTLMKDMLKQMLKINYKSRPTAENLVTDYMKKIIE